MRIVLVTSKIDLETGGGSNSDLDLKAREFMRLGHEVTVITTFSEATKLPFTPPYNVIEEHIAKRDLISIQLGVLRIMRKHQHKADIYYYDGHNFLYGAGLYRFFGGNACVISFFNRELGCWKDDQERYIVVKKKSMLSRLRSATRYALERYVGMPIASAADLHTFTSPKYRELYEQFGLKQKREPLIVGDLFDGEELIRRYHVKEEVLPARDAHTGPFTLFYSGRLVLMRGLDILLKALSEVPARENIRLVLCGTGPEEQALKQLAQELHIAHLINWTGWIAREQTFSYLKDSDLFVMPKGSFGVTSVSLLEAMAFGLPCIVPEGGGLAWVVGAGALNFRQNDYHDMALQIQRLIQERSLRESLRNNGFARLRELDCHKTAERIVRAMQACIADH